MITAAAKLTGPILTGKVNLLAANLTTQVRAIAEVATAVTKGDLTRSIQVDARGEVGNEELLLAHEGPEFKKCGWQALAHGPTRRG